LDHTTPKYRVYAATGLGSTQNNARSSACVGVKGLMLDEDFKSRYMPEGGIIPDIIYTDPVVDWRDLNPIYYDSLRTWIWGNDEIYNGNISTRSTPWSQQMCDGEPCVDPMFRMYSRFDWVKDLHEAAGDSVWPYTYFDNATLNIVCGRRSLDGDGRTLTTGHITGFISHKMETNKPSRKGDVVWGFDPYRFNRAEIQDAIRWVLGVHFDLLMTD
ncbi:MAG: hypothetical protein ABIF77_06060, partial [bacterium]